MNNLTLIGRGPSWEECPFDTPELWGTASCLITEGLSDKKYDKVFIFDNNTIAVELAKMAKERNIPLISPLPFATEFWPARDLVRTLRSSYFLNTMSRMIAYAIYCGYKKIYIYGIDQGPAWGLQQARTHICYWLGVANGKGVDIRLGRGSLAWSYRVPSEPNTEPTVEPEELSLRKALEVG